MPFRPPIPKLDGTVFVLRFPDQVVLCQQGGRHIEVRHAWRV